MTAKTAFLKAFDKIRDKKNWMKEAWAQDSYGNNVDPIDESAVRFCSIGALQSLGNIGSAYAEVELALINNQPSGALLSVIAYNDQPNMTHGKIVDWWCKTGCAMGWIEPQKKTTAKKTTAKKTTANMGGLNE